MESTLSIIRSHDFQKVTIPPSDALVSVGTLITILVFAAASIGQGIPTPSTATANDSFVRSLVMKIVSTDSESERTRLIQEASSTERPLLAKEILDEANRRSSGTAAEAERVARLGLAVAESDGDQKQIGRAWYLISGLQTADREKFDSLSKGLEAAQKASDDDLAVKIIIGLGQIDGTKDQQIERYLSALPYAQRCSDRKVLSGLLGRIGNAYAQNGQFSQAREFHARSLKIKQEMNDRLGIATTISNLGIIYGMLGDTSAALQNFKQSYAILETLTDAEAPNLVQRKAKDLRNLGIVYQGMGDNADALLYYSRSLQMSEDAKYTNGTFGALFQMASLYNGQGDYALVRELLKRASNASDESEIDVELSGLLADSYVGEGRYEEAIRARLKQLADVEKHEGKDDVARCLISIANIYLLMQDAGKAEPYFNRGLEIGQSIGSNLAIEWALSGLSRSKMVAGDFGSALKFAEQTEDQLRKTNRVGNWEVYSTIGAAYSALGKTELARANFEKAIALIEVQRKGISARPEGQQGFFKAGVSPFTSIVGSLVSTNSIEAAFSSAERAKAHTLIEALSPGMVKISGSMTQDERKREQELRNNLAAIVAQIQAEQIASPKGSDKLRDLEKQLADKQLVFDTFQSKVYLDHPELRAQRGEMKPISLEETASLLQDGKTAVAEYVVADDKTFLFIIFKNAAGKVSLKEFTIDIKNTDLAKTVEAFRTKLAAGDLEFQRSSRDLYDLLLKPGQAVLATKNNLIIVPDGPLWNLPFQTLQDGLGKYLVEKSAVSYAPSLTALREMSRKAKERKLSPNAELVAFGNPIVSKETGERARRVFMGEKLEPIPEAERLVNTLKQMYGPARATVYTGADAREETAKAESPKFRIVQFATHGILNNVSPMYSHLVLAQNDKDQNEDGLLEAWEMKELDLKADMVILSACDTARGKVSSGEGMIGMSWALFIAGTPTTVASQWKVESSSTTELMLEFHRQLLSGKKISKAEALRQAELKLMKIPKYKHPSYWAGFVLVGDGS